MASINYATREISCKIVYYGPGLSGKTTNLQIIHKKIPDNDKSEMVSLATETDRTLFFDFLPLDLGQIKGFSTKFQLYTVPGQVYYNATRKLVLRGVDGVVFVADSQISKRDENVESFQNLEENLREYGYSHETIPFVLQYNKRDLPDIMTIPELNALMNSYRLPHYEAIAATGVGVFTTLKAIGKAVIDKFNAKYAGSPGMRRVRPRSEAAPGQAPQAPNQARPLTQPPQAPQGQRPPPPMATSNLGNQGGANFGPPNTARPMAPPPRAPMPGPAPFGGQPMIPQPGPIRGPQIPGQNPLQNPMPMQMPRPAGFPPQAPPNLGPGPNKQSAFPMNNAPIPGGAPGLAPLTPMNLDSVPSASSPFLERYAGTTGTPGGHTPSAKLPPASPFLLDPHSSSPRGFQGAPPAPNLQGFNPPNQYAPQAPNPVHGQGPLSGQAGHPGQLGQFGHAMPGPFTPPTQGPGIDSGNFPTRKLPEESNESADPKKGFWGNLFGKQKNPL